jgi:acyl carrier protein
MVKHGARHLVLVARSKPNQRVKNQLRELELAGAKVVVVQADVSQKEQLERVLLNIEPPLRGIIHSAGVLDDGVLQQQSWPRFTKVFAPKVQGAWHLHQLTTDMQLDFFVLFSSTASLLGSPGQANHAAANAFLDALARFRHSVGLPALSINWGAWSEIGAAARYKVGEAFRIRGMGFISPQQGLDVLEQLLKEPPSQAVIGVVPIDWSEFKSDLPFLRSLQMPEADVASVASPSALPPRFAQQLELAEPSKRRSLLEAHVREELAKVLGFAEPSHISLSQGLFDMGMDSLTSIELRNRLQTSLASQLPSTLVMDYPTLESLVDYLAVEVLGTETPASQEVADVVSMPNDIVSLLAAELMAIEEDKIR